MKTLFTSVAAIFLAYPGLNAQVAPAATGAPTNFSYSFRYAQNAQFGGGRGNWQTATPSAEVDFTSGNARAPFNLNYAGGYTWTLSGPSYSQGFFQRLSLKQEITGRRWNALLGDDVSYRPQAPITGFSGIPGTGEPISTPYPSSQSILNLGTHAVNNNAIGQLSLILNSAFSVSFGGTHDLLRYPDGNGLDTDALSAHGQLTRRINSRNSISGAYIFSRFSYPNSSLSIDTDSAMAIYERSWSRPLSTSVAVGPEWIRSSDSHFVPSSTMLSVSASLTYQLRNGSIALSYDRGTAGGSGYMLGQKSDIIAGAYSREFDRTFTVEFTGGYRRTSALNKAGMIQSDFGSVQASHRLGRYISIFANYTVINQSTGLSLPSTVLRDPLQIVSFGTIITPRTGTHH